MANKTIPAFVIGAVFGGAIAYFGLTNPPGDALTGAVAPAERYRAEQISADDIELGDQSLQDFMQTDVFTSLTSDAAFSAAISSEAFRAALNSEQFRAALNSEQFRAAMNSEQFRAAMNSEQFRAAMNSEQFRAAMNSEQFRAAMNSE
ncbi:MAG: hypothetical protein P8X81_06035, partial [Woeseiaceae bacterium]